MQLAIANPSAALRAEATLATLRERWRRDPTRGGAFVHYLDNFLGQLQSDHTRRAYAYAILEFWDWYEIVHPGSSPTPDRIERRDAIAFADWLTTRQFGLDEVRLKKDPTARLSAAIYAIVKSRGSAGIADVRRSLMVISEFVTAVGGEIRLRVEAESPSGLDRLLACLVEQKLLLRTPSVEELRRADPTLQNRLGERVDPALFVYSIDPHTKAKGSERASTIAARLTALSSLWSYFIGHTGENTGQQPLLSVNVWRDALRQVLGVASSHRAVVREKKTPDVAILQKLLDTTGGQVPLGHQALEDVRDRALLLFLFYTGARADEVGHLRRLDVAREVVTVIGKRRLARSFRVPEDARQALGALTSKIAMLAADAERQAPGRMPRMARLLQDDAPLFPAIARWGCNAHSPHVAEERGLSRQAIAMMMRRRGVAAGIAPGSPDFAKLHPHGLRHLAARTATASGTPVHVVQAVLGHKSLATTGVYLEERDPRRLSLFQDTAEPVAAPPPVRGRPEVPSAPSASAERPRARVVETVGASVATASAVAPALAPGEGLVAIGRLAPLRRVLPSAEEIAAAPALGDPSTVSLDRVYDKAEWGEGGREARQKLREGAAASDSDRLTHAYIGKRTGLVWWDGPTGNLRPQLPVPAPHQFLTPGPYGDLRASLEALWTERVSGADPHHPPSSALALLEWVREARELSDQVDALRKQRSGRWVRYDAPLDVTKLAQGDKARVFRVHREDKLALWFRVRSHAYMATVGRAGDVSARHGQAIDKGPKRPADAGLDWYASAPLAPEPWYALEDPVAALPDAERAELLDWLLVLTGQAPMDTTRRFPRSPTDSFLALSRVDLAGLLLMLCAYDAARDEEQLAFAEHRATAADKEAVAHAAELVDTTVASLARGSTPPFHVEAAVHQRILTRKFSEAMPGAPEEEEAESRASRSEHYLGILRQLFGEAAATDPVLAIYALCSKSQRLADATFAGGDYKDFFRIDRQRRTLGHTDAYKDEFAKRTGADSECVARRVARHLWEQKRGKKKRDQHPSELLWQLNTWAFYKVPCAPAQEQSLAARLRRVGRDSAAELLAILQRQGGEEAELTAAQATPALPIEHEGREASASRGVEGAGLRRTSIGAGAKQEGFVEGWREYGPAATSTGRSLEVLRAEAAARELAEQEKRDRPAPVAVARTLPMKPPQRLGTRRIEAHEELPEARIAAGGRIAVDEPAELETEAEAEREAQRDLDRQTRLAALHARKAGYEPNATARPQAGARSVMDLYFENARHLVPGPVTLLVWIYA